MRKQQYIINLVANGRVRSVIIPAQDKREARKRISGTVKIISVVRVKSNSGGIR